MGVKGYGKLTFILDNLTVYHIFFQIHPRKRIEINRKSLVLHIPLKLTILNIQYGKAIYDIYL